MNVTLFYMKLVYCKNYLNLTNIFVLSLFKRVTNQSTLGLNRVMPSDYSWLRSANYVKFTKEGFKCTEKYVLVKKCLQID